MKIFITGSSGFIGFHTSKKLLNKGFKIFKYNSMNNYLALKILLFVYSLIEWDELITAFIVATLDINGD